MTYHCNKCGYVGETGPAHNVPGISSACNYLAVELRQPAYAEPEMDDEQREMLADALAAIEAHYKAALAALALDEYRPVRARFLTARYEITRILLRMQVAHKMTDGAYAALLLALSQELAIAGLQSYPTDDEKVRNRVLFKHHAASLARAVRAMLVPPIEKNTGLVNTNGKPIRRH